jgi:hypothetical protein
MKDEEFLERAQKDRSRLIAELDDRRRLLRFCSWGMMVLLVLHTAYDWWDGERRASGMMVFLALQSAFAAGSTVWTDALIKSLKLREADELARTREPTSANEMSAR